MCSRHMYCQMSSSVQSESGKARQVLSWPHAALIELPELRSLRFGIPLPERVAEGEDSLLGPCLVLVAACATEGGVEPVRIDRIEQRGRLQAIARRARARVSDPTLIDGVLHARHNQSGTFGLDLCVPVFEDLGEVVPGVHVEDGEGDLSRLERLGGQMQENRRVLAPAEEQDGAFRFGRHLADDEDGQGLQEIEVAEGVLHRPDQGGHRSTGTDRGRTRRARGPGGNGRRLRCPWSLSNHDHFGHVY